MKKNTTSKKSAQKAMTKQIRQQASKQRLTIGLDLGDRSSRYCILDEAGNKISENRLPTTKAGLDSLFAKMPSSRIALEVGTHSPWVSRHLAGLGHEVIVANARKVKLITQNVRKNDRMDAEQLGRLARVDPKLLSPIRHRGEKAQADLAVVRARAELVGTRTKLINCARGLVKPMGERLKPCDAEQVKESLGEGMSEAVQAVVRPVLRCVEQVSEQIREYDRQIAEMEARYPEVKLLKPVYGVGTLIALTYVLTLDDAQRFGHSRDVGPYLGLTRKEHESGASQPELRISKAGDELLRSLLVQGAHCMLRKGAPDSDLRAWGMQRIEGGGKRVKKVTVVAIARKLAVLLHHLWVTGEVYDPRYNRKAAEQAGKKKLQAKAAA